MNNLRIIFVTLIAVFATGCASLSTYQTAQTLNPGESTKSFAISQTAINVDLGVDSAGFNETVKYNVPEMSYRFGVKENIDVGVKIYPIAAIMDVKYQFINKPMFDVSADLGLGYTTISNGATDVTLIDFYPTVLLTYNISPMISATLAPKVIVRSTSGGTSSRTVFIPGSTFTLSFGDAVKGFSVMPEVGFYTLDGVSFTNMGVGLNW